MTDLELALYMRMEECARHQLVQSLIGVCDDLGRDVALVHAIHHLHDMPCNEVSWSVIMPERLHLPCHEYQRHMSPSTNDMLG